LAAVLLHLIRILETGGAASGLFASYGFFIPEPVSCTM